MALHITDSRTERPNPCLTICCVIHNLYVFADWAHYDAKSTLNYITVQFVPIINLIVAHSTNNRSIISLIASIIVTSTNYHKPKHLEQLS